MQLFKRNRRCTSTNQVTRDFVVKVRRCRPDEKWWNWKRHYIAGKPAHSCKPDPFYDLVERVSDGPYLEMFARRARLGDWSYWGDESLQTAEVAA